MTDQKFSEIKEEIKKALRDKGGSLGISEPITLIDGFADHSIHKELTGGLFMSSTTIPTIAVVGDDSGKLYFFALKALLPNLEL